MPGAMATLKRPINLKPSWTKSRLISSGNLLMKEVLVVDDQDEKRFLLEMLLRGHGYRGTSRRHGAGALHGAIRPPDLVISDLLMSP